MKSIINTHFDKKFWLVLAALCAVYLLTNLVLSRLQINTYVKSYFLPSLFWALIILLIWLLPRYRPSGKISVRSSLILMGLVIGISQVVIYALSGLFTGFGRSPYSFTLIGVMTNLILTASMLVGMEFSRAWLLNHVGKRLFFFLVVVSIIYTILSLTLNQLTRMSANMATVEFTGSYLLPSLAESLLASLLALLAGPLASISYRGILQAFWIFSPILPNLPWSFKGLIGVLVPILSMIMIWKIYTTSILHGKVKRQSAGGFNFSWIFTAIIIVLIIWFAVGIFPWHPVMIATGSMTPVVYPGDIVIVAKSSDKNINVGDIIEFRQSENTNIVHRVVAVDDTSGNIAYVTKGDANNDIDAKPVIPDNVVGKVIFVIPKLGWIANAVKSIFI